MIDRILQLKLIGDVSSIDKTLKGTQGRLKGFASSAGGWIKAAGIGLAIGAVEQLGDALGDAWTGFREGEQAGARLGTTWGNLGRDAGELDDVLEAIGASAKRLGADDVEAIDAFNRALLATGGDSTAAMDRLAIAFDLVASGTAPDMAAAMKMIQGAANGSAKVVDAFGLTADTAAGRVAQLGRKVRGAAAAAADLDPVGVLMNALAEDLEGIVGSIAKGDLEGALQSVRDIGTDIGSAWDSVAPKIGETLDKLTGGGWSTFVDTVGPDITQAVDAVASAWGAIAPAIQGAWDLVQPLIGAFGTLLTTTLGLVTGALKVIADLLKGDFGGAWTTAQETVQGAADGLSETFDGIVSALVGIIGEVSTAALDIGSAIWDGIMDGITGLGQSLIDELVAGIRSGLNALIGIWNDLKLPGAGFDFPGVSIDVGDFHHQVIGPQRVNLWDAMDPFPWIAPLAAGGIVTRPTLALMGEAGREAVIPLDRAGALGGSTVIHLTVNAGVGDPVSIGREVVAMLRAYEQRSGRAWRT